jgi:hypothetical protein
MIKNKKVTNYLLYALGEVLLIVIGIVFALQLQNWNESAKTKVNTQRTLERIKSEILANQEKIKGVADYHVMVRDTLDKLEMPTSEKEAKSTFGFWRGLQIPRLQMASFQTAIQTGASKDINVELLEALNELYTFQDAYNEFAKTASQSLYEKDFSSAESFPKINVFLYMVMSDLYYFELQLNSLFTTSLTKIDALNN